MNKDINEIMLDLLIKKAVYGLEGNDESQLVDLQRQSGGIDESLSFELTAASIGMTGIHRLEEMPASLRERIAADADTYFASQPLASIPTWTASTVAEEAPAGSWFGWLGWGLAAVASIVLAFNLFYVRPAPEVVRNPVPTPTPLERLSPAQERLRLMETALDLAKGTWGAGNVKELAPAGDIVWSDAKQAGYMRLSGLPKNDPGKETYQLWIFDETQDDKTPIDGGTFNVAADGEVIVPIDAKLAPRNTKMYAITVEKPGGVVVSKREKIVALAKRET